MPRKAAAATSEGEAAEPRRSSRIKDQPKPEPAPKKAPAKPKSTKKAKEAEGSGEEAAAEKPKSTKGKKRPAEDDGEANGEPPAKKVRSNVYFPHVVMFTDYIINISGEA